MMTYTIEGCLGSVVGRVHSTDEVLAVVKGQLSLSEAAERKLMTRLAGGKLGRVEVDYGGTGCTIHVTND